MELIGEKVTVRTAVESDVDALVEAVLSSLPELERWLPWASVDYSSKDALSWIRGEIDDIEPTLVVDRHGTIVGSCSLSQFDPDLQSANLGYWIRTDRTGEGLAAEATRLLARHALLERDLQLVTISMSAKNPASRKVAERAGAHFEGTLPAALALADGTHDAHAFTFIRSDF